MRYLQSILQSLPVFVLFAAGLVSSGESREPWLPVVVGLGVGAVVGVLALRPLRRSLREGESHWMTRSAPGGCWLFVCLGVVMSVVGIVLWSRDKGLAVDLGLGLLSIVAACFAVIGCWVWREERLQGKEVWMSREGLEFRDPD